MSEYVNGDVIEELIDRQREIAARRDAILAETQADWDEGKVFEATGVTPEAKAEAGYQRLFGSRTGRHTHPVTHPSWLEFTDGDCVVCGVTPEAKREAACQHHHGFDGRCLLCGAFRTGA